MRKHLLALSAALALAPAFNANAQATITEVWKYQTSDFNADFDTSEQPNWSTPDAVMKNSTARFATGRDGKLYTINMKNMSIVEFSKDGYKEFCKLPALTGDDFYGTAISMDEVGNFLIGHYFCQAPLSSQVWTIYCPSDGSHRTFNIGYPGDVKPENYGDNIEESSGTGIGRIDCVGRVLGDLTRESGFFIAPFGIPNAQNVRVVAGYNDEGTTLATVEIEAEYYAGTYLGCTNGQNIAQPAVASIEDFGYTKESQLNAYILCSGQGDSRYDVISCYNGAPQSLACKNMQAAWRALPYLTHNNGFDNFVLDGHRYFVHSYVSSEAELANNSRPMNIAVFNELGEIVATWSNPDYASNGGYNSIIAQPQADGTVLLHIYASCSSMTVGDGKGCVAAAVLKFTPQAADQMPGTANNPILVSNAAELQGLASKCFDDVTYVKLTADIDLSGIDYRVPFSEAFGKSKTIHFDGNNHIIRNLKPSASPAQNGSVFGAMKGSIKNLGVHNVDIDIKWFCTGALVGVSVGDLTIDNCYATGSVKGAASGGLVGACIAGNLTITNCYARVNTENTTDNGFSAGILARADSPVSISNVYATGTVISAFDAAGIVNVDKSTSVNLSNVIAWNTAVTSTDTSTDTDSGTAAPVVNGEAQTNGVLVFNGMTVNDTPVANGETAENLFTTATAWTDFKAIDDDNLPVLSWQTASPTAGINNIIAEPIDAPAEYYNLQGVKIANPSNGIYIVRRGNKVTKEIIR